MSNQSDDGYIIEYQRLGNQVKVTAIDPASGLEVSIVGAPYAGKHTLARTAVDKLHYVLAKRKAEDAEKKDDGGIVV